MYLKRSLCQRGCSNYNRTPFDLFGAIELRVKSRWLLSLEFRCRGVSERIRLYIIIYHIKWKARLSGTVFFFVLTTPSPARVRVTSAKSKVFWRLLSSAKTKDEPLGRERDRNGNNVQTREWAIRARDEYQKPNADRAYYSQRRWRTAAAGDSKFGLTTSGRLYTQPYTHAATYCVYLFYGSRMHICTRPDCYIILLLYTADRCWLIARTPPSWCCRLDIYTIYIRRYKTHVHGDRVIWNFYAVGARVRTCTPPMDNRVTDTFLFPDVLCDCCGFRETTAAAVVRR